MVGGGAWWLQAMEKAACWDSGLSVSFKQQRGRHLHRAWGHCWHSHLCDWERKKQASIRAQKETSELENVPIVLSPLSAPPGNHCFGFKASLFLIWNIAKAFGCSSCLHIHPLFWTYSSVSDVAVCLCPCPWALARFSIVLR